MPLPPRRQPKTAAGLQKAITALDANVAQAEFIHWPALAQSFKQQKAALLRRQANLAKAQQ